MCVRFLDPLFFGGNADTRLHDFSAPHWGGLIMVEALRGEPHILHEYGGYTPLSTIRGPQRGGGDYGQRNGGALTPPPSRIYLAEDG